MSLSLRTHVLVLGLGETGLSMARWLVRLGAQVRVADSRDNPPNAERLRTELPEVALEAGPFREKTFRGIELMAISPGVPLADPLVAKAVAKGMPVVGDIELFARALTRSRRAKVIGVSGSNGKSTVTTMAGEMCKAAGLGTVVAGNIGLPVLDALIQVEEQRDQGKEDPQVYVLELSSFQLETTEHLDADAATVLNLSEDHLDRYPDMPAYASAKARIFKGRGAQVLNRDDRWSCSMAIEGRKVLRFGLDTPATDSDWGIDASGGVAWLAQGAQRLMPVADLPVAGWHNAANALAALCLCRAIDLPYPPLLQALREFHGLPHRVQEVARVGGVTFYDDSKGTNVGATVAALEGMPQKVVLIAGGDGKGQNFAPLKEPVGRRARAVVLIGRDAEKIAAAIEGCGLPVERAATMEEAVEKSLALAEPGDAVLLSPACASFDMFRNYEHRAQVYVDAVKGLLRAKH